MSKSIPGPWTFNEFGDNTVRAKQWGVVASMSRHDSVPGQAETVAANAALIALAPEMLPLVRFVAFTVQTVDPDHKVLIDAARALLAKLEEAP